MQYSVKHIYGHSTHSIGSHFVKVCIQNMPKKTSVVHMWGAWVMCIWLMVFNNNSILVPAVQMRYIQCDSLKAKCLTSNGQLWHLLCNPEAVVVPSLCINGVSLTLQ